MTMFAVVVAASTAAVSSAAAPAATHEAASAAVSPTPYLDQIERAVRQVSPGLEHRVWERSHGNRLDDSAGDWLLQTPQCWGHDPCPLRDRPGTKRLLEKITDNIGEATGIVDITSLGCPEKLIARLPSPCGTFPDGVFRDAIVAGLKKASEKHKITFRMLLGAPVLPATVNGDDWINAAKKTIGASARDIDFHVATMTTSYSGTPGVPIGGYTPSWNHSKLIVVDGRTVITGGVNTYTNNYVQTPKPVTDMMMAIRGPAATSAGNYINRLWEWTCANRHTRNWAATTGSWVYPSGRGCVSHLSPPAAARAGDLDMLEVGGLGVGIQAKDPSSTYKLPGLNRPEDAKCDLRFADKDVVNLDRDYQTVNPEETALREMVATATHSIVFSQQDLYGWCATIGGPIKAVQPLGDLRLLDNLAAKMIRGVKVRIVISTPGNEDSYSTMRNMGQFSDLLRKRIALQAGGDRAAETVMQDTLQYASLRSSVKPRWEGKATDDRGKVIDCDDPKKPCTYAQHTKLVVVDDRVFYLGSKNAYPAFLQDDGYFVESPAAVAHIRREFLDPQWNYSQADATYDWKRFLPPTVVAMHTERVKNTHRVKVTVQAVTHSGDPFLVGYGNKVECRDVASGHRCSFEEDASIVGKTIDIVDEKTLRWTRREVRHW
jgi:phosphatidylserine/phosphatidylglycerophosphate/cardiolipin synthase-like enzyme